MTRWIGDKFERIDFLHLRHQADRYRQVLEQYSGREADLIIYKPEKDPPFRRVARSRLPPQLVPGFVGATVVMEQGKKCYDVFFDPLSSNWIVQVEDKVRLPLLRIPYRYLIKSRIKLHRPRLRALIRPINSLLSEYEMIDFWTNPDNFRGQKDYHEQISW